MHHLLKLQRSISISGNYKLHYLFNKEPLENWLDNTQNIIDINYSTQQNKTTYFSKESTKHMGVCLHLQHSVSTKSKSYLQSYVLWRPGVWWTYD